MKPLPYLLMLVFLLISANVTAQLPSCGPLALFPGCTDPCDSNYDPGALCDDGSCNNDNGRCVCPTVLQPYNNHMISFCGGEILDFPNPVTDGVVDNLDNATLAWLPTNGGVLEGTILANLTCSPNEYTYNVQATCWPALGFPSTVNLGTVRVIVYPDPVTNIYSIIPSIPCIPLVSGSTEPTVIPGLCVDVTSVVTAAQNGCPNDGDVLVDGNVAFTISSPDPTWPCSVNEVVNAPIPACEECLDCPALLNAYNNHPISFCGGDILSFPDPVADGVVDDLDNATVAWLPLDGGLFENSLLINLLCTPQTYTYQLNITCFDGGIIQTINGGTVQVSVYPDPITYNYSIIPAIPCLPFVTPTIPPSIIPGPCLVVTENFIPPSDACPDTGGILIDGLMEYTISSPDPNWPCAINVVEQIDVPACELCPQCPTTAGDFGTITDICSEQDLIDLIPNAVEVIISLLTNPSQVYTATVYFDPDPFDPANWPVLAPGDCGPTTFDYNIVVGCTIDSTVALPAGTISVTLWDFNPANYNFEIVMGACGTIPTVVETGQCELGEQLGVILELPVDGCPDDGDPVQNGVFTWAPTLPFQCLIETQIDFPPPITIPIPYCNTCPSDCPTSAGDFGIINDICSLDDFYNLIPNFVSIIASIANNPNSVLNTTVTIEPNPFDPANWPVLAPGDCGPTVFAYDIIVGCTLDPTVQLDAGTIEVTMYDVNPANYGFEVVQGGCGALPVLQPSGPCALGEQVGIVLEAPVDGCPDNGDPVQDGIFVFDLDFPGACYIESELPPSFTVPIPYCNTCNINTPCTPLNGSTTHAGAFCAAANNVLDLTALETGTPGGTWTMNGDDIGTSIDISEAGTYTLVYTVSPPTNDPSFCVSASSIQTIVVYPEPNAGSDNTTLLCNDASEGPAVVNLNSLLSNDAAVTGYWTALGTSPPLAVGSIFNAEGKTPGVYEYEYIVGELGAGLGINNACPNDVATVSITVDDCDATVICSPLDASLSPAPSLCVQAGSTFDLNTLVTGDAGGTFNIGTTVGASLLDLSNAGEYTVTYLVNPPATDPSSCAPAVASQLITVLPLPDAGFTVLDSIYCEEEEYVVLNPNVTGGTFSGEGITNNVFNPRDVISFGDEIEISYTVTGANGCSHTSSQYVTVYPSLMPDFTPLNSTYWTFDNPVPLTGDNAGGTFSGDCVNNGVFYPSMATVGEPCAITHSIGSGNCVNTSLQYVTVYACTPPSNINVNVLGAYDAVVSWNAIPNGPTYTLQYRPVGNILWETINISSNSVLISNLQQCTEYEAQLSTGCDDMSSAFTTPITFTTEGCGLVANIRVFLEAPYDVTNNSMHTILQNNGLLPYNHPYWLPPYNYDGNESIQNINAFPMGIVDWVLVELREVNNPNIVIAQKAALLQSDGFIVEVSTNGTTGVIFDDVVAGTYFIVVRHHNHLDVLSRTPILLPSGTTVYDFTSAPTQAYGPNQQTALSNGKAAMFAGDMNGDGVITYTDFNVYSYSQSSINLYASADLNLDANVSVADFNWYMPNASQIGISFIRY